MSGPLMEDFPLYLGLAALFIFPVAFMAFLIQIMVMIFGGKGEKES